MNTLLISKFLLKFSPEVNNWRIKLLYEPKQVEVSSNTLILIGVLFLSQ